MVMEPAVWVEHKAKVAKKPAQIAATPRSSVFWPPVKAAWVEKALALRAVVLAIMVIAGRKVLANILK